MDSNSNNKFEEGMNMKVIRRTTLALALLAAIGFSSQGSVALAQEVTPTTVAVAPVVQPVVERRDEGFPWGLLGLLGLAGLAGLKPKEHTHQVERVDRTSTRP